MRQTVGINQRRLLRRVRVGTEQIIDESQRDYRSDNSKLWRIKVELQSREKASCKLHPLTLLAQRWENIFRLKKLYTLEISCTEMAQENVPLTSTTGLASNLGGSINKNEVENAVSRWEHITDTRRSEFHIPLRPNVGCILPMYVAFAAAELSHSGWHCSSVPHQRHENSKSWC